MSQKITPFLTYNGQVEQAANLYTSVFKNSKIVSTPKMNGQVFSATIELEGQTFLMLNGGPSFSFAQGISLFVNCETQEEVDEPWEKLTANGGEPGRCGWLKDPFGVSWQIVPSILGKLMGNPAVVKAMMGMNKLDIAALKRAAEA